MKPRVFLLTTFVLLSTLACNLPFASPAEELTPTASPLVLATSLPTIAATQPSASSLPPPTTIPNQLPSATPEVQATVPPPAAPPVELHNPYAVVLVADNDVLNARRLPGSTHPVVGTLPPDATGLELTGKDAIVGDDRWVEIRLPTGGSGWVNAYYLTEQVASAAFCADPRLGQLVVNLRQAMLDGDGQLLSSLVSPTHGLDLLYLRTGNTANYSAAEASWIFQSDYVMNWGVHPASGLNVTGSFSETALPDLIDVMASTFQTQCNNPDLGGGNYVYTWPMQYRNINYLVLHKPGPPGNELAWRTWIAGIEYVAGQPYLFSLVHLFWEP